MIEIVLVGISRVPSEEYLLKENLILNKFQVYQNLLSDIKYLNISKLNNVIMINISDRSSTR